MKMDRGGAEKIIELLGSKVDLTPVPDEGEDQRYVSLIFETSPELVSPASLLNKLGRAGLMAFDPHTTPEFGPLLPALRVLGQSSTYTGSQGLRYYLTLEDLNYGG